MRRIQRIGLPQKSADFLARQHGRLPRGTPPAVVDQEWKKRRKQCAALRDAVSTLRMMARQRQRCMYCEDSRATDIEHFWPKSAYPERLFDWDNLLLVCADCNRKKNARFPLDAGGQPLVLNPTTDDPWKHLFYEPRTGLLTARQHQGRSDTRGDSTLSVINALEHEAVTEGRQRATRNLERAVNAFLAAALAAGVTPARDPNVRELNTAIRDNDAYGLGQWYFLHDGATSTPFCELRARYPVVWQGIVAIVSA